MEAWPERLKRLRYRISPRLSQAKVAKYFGIASSSVAQWETGRSKPTIDKLPLLAVLYKVSLAELCGHDIPFPDLSPEFKGTNERDELIEEQLLLLRRAWGFLSIEERRALLAAATALSAPRLKAA